LSNSQQGRVVEAESAIKTLWGKGKVEEVMVELRGSSTGSVEEDAGWLDLFSKRYWKGISLHIVLADTISWLAFWEGKQNKQITGLFDMEIRNVIIVFYL